MEENIENINRIREMEKEIAELKMKKEDILHTSPVESPKDEEIKEQFISPDPITPILNEPPKTQKKSKTSFEGGIYIKWIDKRYHIHGIRGFADDNKIIVRSLAEINNLIGNLKHALDNFKQDEMISTKKK